MIITLRSYDPVNADEPRLLRLIDDSALIIGRLIEVLEDSNNRSQRFTGALSMLMIVVYLRAFTMIERERRSGFSNPEIKDISLMMDLLKSWLNESILGIGNVDERVICNLEAKPLADGQTWGFRFDGAFVSSGYQQLANPRDGVQAESPVRAQKQASKACQRQKEALHLAITNYKKELDRCDDFLDRLPLN